MVIRNFMFGTTTENKSKKLSIGDLGKKRIDVEYRQRQTTIDAERQQRKSELANEYRRKGRAQFLAESKSCERDANGIFKFQREFINSPRFTINERYEMINRARALYRKGKVLPEVEKIYSEK